MNSKPNSPPDLPEHKLLLCCARTTIDAKSRDRICALLREKIDWPYLIQLAANHQVAPMLCWNLCATFSENCPPAVIDQLKFLLHGNAARNSFLARELLNLLDLFSAHNIRCIPYKGPVLSELAYGHRALRSFADLDILVHEWDYHVRIADLLISDGWQVTAEYAWEMSFRNTSSSVQLDVHAALTPKQIQFPLDFNHVWKRRVPVKIGGKSVRTFSPSDLLIVLCVQLAKDAGESRPPPLIKLCDVAELVRRHPSMDWTWVIKQSKKLGVHKILMLALQTATEMLDVSLPQEVMAEMPRYRDLSSLVTHVKERILRGGAPLLSRPELLNGQRWYAEIRERARDRYGPTKALLDALMPNPRDYAYVKLPRRLFPLYYAVKPIRLIGKYSIAQLNRLRHWRKK